MKQLQVDKKKKYFKVVVDFYPSKDDEYKLSTAFEFLFSKLDQENNKIESDNDKIDLQNST